MSEENHAQNPYEMLGVAPNATMAEILKAYSQAMSRHAHTPQELARALSTLRGKLTRAETDLFTLPDMSSLLAETMQAVEQTNVTDAMLQPPPALQVSDLVVLPEAHVDAGDLTPCPLEIMLPKTQLNLSELMPPVQIDIWETMNDDQPTGD